MKLRSTNSNSGGFNISAIFRYHALSFKIALMAGTISGGSAFILVLVLGIEAAIPALGVAILSTIGVYYSARNYLDARIEFARETLRRTRKYKFRTLQEADLPKGDELNDLIRQVYRTGLVLEREIRRLKRMENYRRVFIGNVSHELKTPVFAIQGYAETLLGGAIDDEVVNREFVQKIINNSERLNNLTSDLVEISRIETGELQMSFEPFQLKSIFQDIMDSLDPIAGKNRLTLSADMPHNLPAVIGDARRIRQVLVNLVDNALKYTDPGGSVEILAEEGKKGFVRIAIKDTGIGIPKKYVPRLTERFFRIDKSRSRSAGGTGLGLAIVKHILAAHKQRIRIDSSEGEGSTFEFSLPIAGSADVVSG